MTHRYHGNIVDNYLLVDSPQRISTLKLYPCGYETDERSLRLRRGIRRLILLRLARSAETNEFKEYAAATPGWAVPSQSSRPGPAIPTRHGIPRGRVY
jgi:hypothetical protein